METGDDYTCLMVEGRPVAGAFPPQMDGIPPHWDVYFNVEDCDATVARAVELGAGELVAPYDVPGVGRTAMVRDPQGALVGVPPEPARRRELESPTGSLASPLRVWSGGSPWCGW